MEVDGLTVTDYGTDTSMGWQGNFSAREHCGYPVQSQPHQIRARTEGRELIMALDSSRLSAEPLMDVTDKLAAHRPTSGAIVAGQADRVARPFGLRFTVSPLRAGEHSKTYYTVTVEETTHLNKDGTEVTETDYVDKEKED